jgi:hypothetical protein
MRRLTVAILLSVGVIAVLVNLLLLTARGNATLTAHWNVEKRVASGGDPCGIGVPADNLEVEDQLPLASRHIVLLTHVSTPLRAASVAAHWARRRCILLLRRDGVPSGPPVYVTLTPMFFSVAPDALAAVVQGDDGSILLPDGMSGAMRTERALPLAALRFPHADWIFKADDDTFVHVGRLVRMLLRWNASAPLLVGSVQRWGGFPYFVSGGAGYALSAGAVAGLASPEVMADCVDAHHQGGNTFRPTNFEDVMMSWCVRSRFGGGATVDEPGLSNNRPEEHVAGGSYVGAKAFVPPITHHYIEPSRAADLLEPRLPRRLVQVWPLADSAINQVLLDNVAGCAVAARAAGWEYVREPLAAPANAGVPSRLSLRAQELVGRLHALYLGGGVSVSAWVSCAGIPLEKLHAEAAAPLELDASPLDPLGSSSLGSPTRHVLSCGTASGVDVGCGVAASTPYALATLRLQVAVMQAANVRNSAWPPHDGSESIPFATWLMRSATLAALSAAMNAPLRSLSGAVLRAPLDFWTSTVQWAARNESPLPSPTSPPPLRVTVHSMWAGVRAVMAELQVLSRLMYAATGRYLEPVDDTLTQEGQLDAADVILFGPYGERAAADAVALRYAKRALTIYIGPENQWGGSYHDQMVGVVAVSLGHRRDLVHPTYARLPWWLPYSLDLVTPPLHEIRFAQLLTAAPSVSGFAAAAAWLARPRAAALLASHEAFPRRPLFEMLSLAGIAVDAPGRAFHNIEWPPGLPNSHLNGKVEFLMSYRYNVCPENSVSGGGGYSTEKLAQALMAGTVPIYWGDAIDSHVFNEHRVIVFDGGNNASVLETVRSLESDAAFREQWFDAPVLAPTAQAWLRIWCGVVVELFRAGMARLASERAAGAAAVS